MPENISIIEYTNELPRGTLRMIQLDKKEDAEYYANGKPAFFFQSRIIKAMYLFIPIMIDE